MGSQIVVPFGNLLLNGKTGFASKEFIDFYLALTQRLAQTEKRFPLVSFGSGTDDGYAASLAPTPIPIGNTDAGLFRITYHLDVVQVAGTSSAVQVSFGWQHHGHVKAISGLPVNLNTLDQPQWGELLVRRDQGSSLTYSTTYASVGAPEMRYTLDIVTEQVEG